MCCSLLTLLVIFVIFTPLQNFAQQEHWTPKGTQRPCEGKETVVLASKGKDLFVQPILEKDQTDYFKTSQQRPSIYCSDSESNGHGRGRRCRVFSLALPMWANQQEVCSHMRHMPWLLDCWHAAQNSAESIHSGVRVEDIHLGRVGRLGELGERQPCLQQSLESSPLRTAWSINELSNRSTAPCQRERRQERQEQREKPGEATARYGLTFPKRRSQFCPMAFLGFFQIHAILRACTEPPLLL